MTFLEICVKLKNEAGVSGTLSTVTGNTGELDRVVEWAKDAWTDLQNSKSGKWRFLWTAYTKSITSGTGDYDYNADSIKSFDKDTFGVYLTADGATTKRRLPYMEYKNFQNRYLDLTTTGYPSVVTLLPDNTTFRVYPTPDDTYTFSCDAFTLPIELAVDADVPAMADGHKLIVYKALLDYAGYEEAGSVLQYAKLRVDELYNNMIWKYLVDEEETMVVRPR